MSLTPNCPKCQKQVTVPDGVSTDAIVRCPLCQAEYSISEALALLPPLLIVVRPGIASAVAAASVSPVAAPVGVEEDHAVQFESLAPPDAIPVVEPLAHPVAEDVPDDVIFGDMPAEMGSGAEHDDGVHAFDHPPAVPLAEPDGDAAPWNEGWHPMQEGAGEHDSEAIAIAEDEHAEHGEDEGFGDVDFAAITGRAPAGEATAVAEGAEPTPAAPVKRKRPKRETSMVGRLIGILISGLLALPAAYGIGLLVNKEKYDFLHLFDKKKDKTPAVAQETPKAKPDAKPQAGTDTQPPAKPETIPEVKPAAGTETKPATGPEKKTEVADSGASPDNNPFLAPNKPETKPEPKPTPKPGTIAKAKTDDDPFSDKPEKEPEAKSDPLGAGDPFAPKPDDFKPVAPSVGAEMKPEVKPPAKPAAGMEKPEASPFDEPTAPAKPEVKPPAKPETKPAAGTEKPEPSPFDIGEPTAPVKPEAKPQAKPETKPAVGTEKPEPSPFDIGEPAAPAKPAKPEVKPEPKVEIKPEPKVEIKPEPKPDVPPAGTIVPVKAPSFASADLAKSLESVGKPPAELTDQAYDKLRQVALVATYAKGLTPEQNQAVRTLADQVAASPKAAEKIADSAKKILADKAPSGGIVLAGTVAKATMKDGVQWVAVKVADAPKPVLVLCPQPVDVKENDRLLVLGAIVVEPTQNLAGYTGTQPLVIWGGPAVKLP